MFSGNFTSYFLFEVDEYNPEHFILHDYINRNPLYSSEDNFSDLFGKGIPFKSKDRNKENLISFIFVESIEIYLSRTKDMPDDFVGMNCLGSMIYGRKGFQSKNRFMQNKASNTPFENAFIPALFYLQVIAEINYRMSNKERIIVEPKPKIKNSINNSESQPSETKNLNKKETLSPLGKSIIEIGKDIKIHTENVSYVKKALTNRHWKVSCEFTVAGHKRKKINKDGSITYINIKPFEKGKGKPRKKKEYVLPTDNN